MSLLFRHSGEKAPHRLLLDVTSYKTSLANLPHFAGTAKGITGIPGDFLDAQQRRQDYSAEPVDEGSQVTDHPARAGLEALMDQKLFAQRIKSERASAYWFAASLWGVTGPCLAASSAYA